MLNFNISESDLPNAVVQIDDLFRSPEFYPREFDFDRGLVTFVRMTRETYSQSAFLGYRLEGIGDPVFLRLDDLLFAARNAREPTIKTHYILNTAYCCSTLLSRYFEVLPECHVLREPGILAQVALLQDKEDPRCRDFLEVCLKVLMRTYEEQAFIIIKPYEPCNRLARSLLGRNTATTATYLMTPLKSYLLSVLKEEARRDWARSRLPSALRDASRLGIKWLKASPRTMAQTIAFIWLLNYCIFLDLVDGIGVRRVQLLNGDVLAESPRSVLESVMDACGLHIDGQRMEAILSSGSTKKYSKDTGRAYDAASYRTQLDELERCWGTEASDGIEWAESMGFGQRVLQLDAAIATPSRL